VYGLGTLATRLVGFVLIPVYTRILPPATLGVVEVLTVAGGLLVTLAGLGLGSALFRYLYDAPDDVARDRLVGSAALTVGGTALVVAALLLALAGPVSHLLLGTAEYAGLVRILAITVVVEAGLVVPLALLRVREASGLFASISLGRFVVNLGLNLWFVVGLGLGALGILLGNALAAGAVALGFIPMVVGRLRAGIATDRIRRLLRFGVPLMFATLASVLLESLDKPLLARMRGLDEAGVYGVAYRFAKLVHVLVVQPFTLAWPAVMWSIAKRPEAPRVYARVMTYAVAATALVALGMSVFRGEVFLLAHADYASGAAVLPWIVFGYVFAIAYFVASAGVFLAERTELATLVLLIALAVNAGLNLLLIPDLGGRGAALATLAAYVVMCGGMLVAGQRLRPIPYEWERLTGVLLAAGGCLVLGLGAEAWSGGKGILARAAVVVLFVALVSPAVVGAEERAALSRWRTTR
jgi:O-antigen/teichoic acid export membrane protein